MHPTRAIDTILFRPLASGDLESLYAAVLSLAKYAFGELKLSRIEIVAQVDNVASRRVAERVGCRFEGIARNRIVHEGRPRDAALYSLIPGDIDG